MGSGGGVNHSPLPCPCPPVPEHPASCSVDKNINEAKQHNDPNWFKNQVRNGGPWDYKKQGSQYQNFGNFNYGATGSAYGFPTKVLLRMAGWAQQQAGTSLPQWGNPYGDAPYGDDPADQGQIKNGIKYFQCNCSR